MSNIDDSDDFKLDSDDDDHSSDEDFNDTSSSNEEDDEDDEEPLIPLDCNEKTKGTRFSPRIEGINKKKKEEKEYNQVRKNSDKPKPVDHKKKKKTKDMSSEETKSIRRTRNPQDVISIIEFALKRAVTKDKNMRKKRQREHDDYNDNGVNHLSVRRTRSLSKKRRRAAIPNLLLPQPPFVPNNLDELVKLAELSKEKCFRDCQILPVLVEPLKQLQMMIGLTDIKQKIFNMLFLRLQKKYITLPQLGHIILCGPPGTGKTTLVQILAKILAAVGDLSSDKVVNGTASSMVASFLGQTAPKTEALIKSAFGGVLVIDEANSLADGRSNGSGDSFSKSAIDTLNRHLTEDGDKFICILSGYKDEIDRDIMSINPGLQRRFNNVFEMKGYTKNELRQISLLKLKEKKLKLEENVELPIDIFTEKNFPSFAGDAAVYIDNIVLAHARNVFGLIDKDTVDKNAVQVGTDNYIEQQKNKRKTPDTAPLTMYT